MRSIPSIVGEYNLNHTSTPTLIICPRRRNALSTPRRRILISTPANGGSPPPRRTCRMSPTRIASRLWREKRFCRLPVGSSVASCCVVKSPMGSRVLGPPIGGWMRIRRRGVSDSTRVSWGGWRRGGEYVGCGRS